MQNHLPPFSSLRHYWSHTWLQVLLKPFLAHSLSIVRTVPDTVFNRLLFDYLCFLCHSILLFFSWVQEILHINVKESSNLIKSVQVWLNTITAPFAYGTIWLAQFLSEPSACLALFDKYNFTSIEIWHKDLTVLDLVQR